MSLDKKRRGFSFSTSLRTRGKANKISVPFIRFLLQAMLYCCLDIAFDHSDAERRFIKKKRYLSRTQEISRAFQARQSQEYSSLERIAFAFPLIESGVIAIKDASLSLSLSLSLSRASESGCKKKTVPHPRHRCAIRRARSAIPLSRNRNYTLLSRAFSCQVIQERAIDRRRLARALKFLAISRKRGSMYQLARDFSLTADRQIQPRVSSTSRLTHAISRAARLSSLSTN